MLRLVLRLIFVTGADGAGAGAVGGAVTVILQETAATGTLSVIQRGFTQVVEKKSSNHFSFVCF